MEPTQPSLAPYPPQSTPPATPPPTFPSSPSPVPKHGAWKMPIAIIISVLVLAGGAYALMNRAPATPVAQLTLTPSPTPTATPTPDPTSGWKTYTNTQNGFEFRYPNSWLLEGDDYMISVMNYDPKKDNASLARINDGMESFSVTSLRGANTNGLTSEKLAEQVLLNMANNKTTVVSSKSMTINGETAQLIFSVDYGVKIGEMVIVRGKDLYKLSCGFNWNYCEKIIRTFRFTK